MAGKKNTKNAKATKKQEKQLHDYVVTVSRTETLVSEVTVEAYSKEEALELVNDMIDSGSIEDEVDFDGGEVDSTDYDATDVERARIYAWEDEDE